MGVVYSVSDVFSASREGNTELYLTPIFKLVSSRAELPRPSGTSKGLQRVTHFAPHVTRFRYRPSKFDLFTFSRVYATSRHIPGVRFAGISHPGLIGTAPSSEMLATWNKREAALIAEHVFCFQPVKPLVSDITGQTKYSISTTMESQSGVPYDEGKKDQGIAIVASPTRPFWRSPKGYLAITGITLIMITTIVGGIVGSKGIKRPGSPFGDLLNLSLDIVQSYLR